MFYLARGAVGSAAVCQSCWSGPLGASESGSVTGLSRVGRATGRSYGVWSVTAVVVQEDSVSEDHAGLKSANHAGGEQTYQRTEDQTN